MFFSRNSSGPLDTNYVVCNWDNYYSSFCTKTVTNEPLSVCLSLKCFCPNKSHIGGFCPNNRHPHIYFVFRFRLSTPLIDTPIYILSLGFALLIHDKLPDFLLVSHRTDSHHLCTCTTHSGVKKAHDWEVHQLPDLFHTSKVKTQQVVKRRGQHCGLGDIELVGNLVNTVTAGPVSLVLDLRIDYDRFGSSSDPNLNGKLHWPNDIDKSPNEDNTDKIRKYR
jgi:hypothetical protein